MLTHAGGERRQRRVGSAVRPAGADQGWRTLIARVSTNTSSSPNPGAGRAASAEHGRVALQGIRGTARYLGGERRDLTVSYVWAKGTADLNNYDQFFGNFRNPIMRANEHNLIPTDVRHRVLLRGNIGLLADGEVGLRAGPRTAVGIPVVGGGRVPGFRRRAQSRRAFALGGDPGFRAHARRGGSRSTGSAPA